MRKTISITVDEKVYKKWLDLCFKLQEIAIKNRKTISKGRIGEKIFSKALDNVDVKRLKEDLQLD